MKNLADSNPSDPLWQRDLCVVYNKIGNALLSQHKPAEALDQFMKGDALIETLAVKTTQTLVGNAIWLSAATRSVEP